MASGKVALVCKCIPSPIHVDPTSGFLQFHVITAGPVFSVAWGWPKHFYVKWLTIFKQATECTATQLHTINQPYLLTKSRPRYSTFTHWQDVFQPIPGLISIWVYVHIHCVEIRWCPLLVCWKADIVTINDITWHHMTSHDITWHHNDKAWSHMSYHPPL